jgi:hypothetical protein
MVVNLIYAKVDFLSLFFFFFFFLWIWFTFDTLIVHLETILNASNFNTKFSYRLVHVSFLVLEAHTIFSSTSRSSWMKLY